MCSFGKFIDQYWCVISRLYFIFFVCTATWSQAFAQHDPSHRKQIIIRLSPCSMIDINDGPSLRAGLEYDLSDRISLFMDGKKYFYFPSNATWVTKTAVVGHAVIPGIKWHLNRRTESLSKKDKYLQFWYVYKDQAYTINDSIIANSNHIFRSVRMHQYSNSFAISYGEQTAIGQTHFILDWYTGLGIRSYNSSSDLPPGQQAYDYHDWTGDLTFYPNTAIGHRIYPSFLLGLIIAYRL